MKETTTPDIKTMLSAVHYRPCVSILMPFEPAVALKTELDHKLKIAVDEVSRKLANSYPEEKTASLLQRCRNLLKELDYNSKAKSIAIYINPLMQKVVYLDIPVEQKIIIDESFEIRDLLYSKKNIYKFLVLLLSAEHTKILLGGQGHLVQIKTEKADDVNAIWNDVSERVSNFSDPAYRKEVMLDKFLKYTDESLGTILKAYPFPVFVMGTDRTTGHFRKITKNESRVAGYVHGNYEEAGEQDIAKALTPLVSSWKKDKQAIVLQQLDTAMSAGKLAVGIDEVWRAATEKKGRLLVTEKNYMYIARHSDDEAVIYEGDEAGASFPIRDAVDDVIEKVLQSGGDVEFVEEGMLKEYGHIALVQYF